MKELTIIIVLSLSLTLNIFFFKNWYRLSFANNSIDKIRYSIRNVDFIYDKEETISDKELEEIDMILGIDDYTDDI